jgi:serine/threonine kinase 16
MAFWKHEFVFHQCLGAVFVNIMDLYHLSHHERALAVKRILLQSTEQEMGVLREIALHQKLDHPNILKIVDAGMYDGKKGTYACLVFPLYRNGSLQECIMEAPPNKPPFEEKECLRMFVSICSAVMEMHRNGLRHGDIKPANVLLSSDNPPSPILMDLGSASALIEEIQDKSDVLDLQEKSAMHCSAPYRPPELWNVPLHSTIDGATDVWSLGCTLYALAYGHSPFESPEEGLLTLAIVNGTLKFPYGNRHFSLRFKSLIEKCLYVSPADRITLKGAMDLTEQMIREESWKCPESSEPPKTSVVQKVKPNQRASAPLSSNQAVPRQLQPSLPTTAEELVPPPTPVETFANFADFDSAFAGAASLTPTVTAEASATAASPPQPTPTDVDDEWGDFETYDKESCSNMGDEKDGKKLVCISPLSLQMERNFDGAATMTDAIGGVIVMTVDESS